MLSAVFMACGQSSSNKSDKPQVRQNGVEVLSFHAKKRCPTCIAIEQLTREVVESEFATQLADSSLVLRVVDIAENEELADQYEITWSALLVNRYKDGKDLTRFAFANARTNPEKFKAELKAQIEKMLAE